MKLFCFDTSIVETDDTIGQNTVYIGQNQLDVFYSGASHYDFLGRSAVDILMTVAFSFLDGGG